MRNLRSTFQEKRNCTFRELLSPKKTELLLLLSDEYQLLRFFSTQEVPAVFILFILSHGSEGGKIFTDHYQEGSQNYIHFTTTEVLDSLSKLNNFSSCLKFVNFGPCRGNLDDSIHQYAGSLEASYDNRNSCSVTFTPEMHNLIIMFSTVETTTAIRNNRGSWLVRMTCESLNALKEDKQILPFLTGIQFKTHIESRSSVDIRGAPCGGQTLELKMFSQDALFVVSALPKESQVRIESSCDANGRRYENSRPSRPEHFYTWQSDREVNVRGRRAVIFLQEWSDLVENITEALSKNLSFDTSHRWLTNSNLRAFLQEDFEGGVGCLLTCVFGKVVTEHERSNEVCVCVEGKIMPVGDIMHNFIGPKNATWIGKPKIFFIIDQQTEEKRDNLQSCTPQAETILATNHSGWLVLILKNNDLARHLIDILNDKQLTKGKSLQVLLAKLLICSKGNSGMLLNSTLQYLLNFPDWPREFVKPFFFIAKDQGVPLWSSSPITYANLLEMATPTTCENRVWLFSSEAGSGKTTVLKEIAFDLARLLPGVKILRISLSNMISYISDHYSTLKPDKLIAKATHHSPEEIRAVLNERNKAIVLLDGFDEVPDERENVLLVAKYLIKKNVPLWISTRPQEAKYIRDEILKDEEKTAIEKPREGFNSVFDTRLTSAENQNSQVKHFSLQNSHLNAEMKKNVSLWISTSPQDEEKTASEKPPEGFNSAFEKRQSAEKQKNKVKLVWLKNCPLNAEMQVELLQMVTKKSLVECQQFVKEFEDKTILENPFHLTLVAQCGSTRNLYKIYEQVVEQKVEKCLVEKEGLDTTKPTYISRKNKALSFLKSTASHLITRRINDAESMRSEAQGIKNLEKLNDFGIATVESGQVTFVHQTFIEFLAAQQYLDKIPELDKNKNMEFLEEMWKHPQCMKFIDLYFSTDQEEKKFRAFADDSWKFFKQRPARFLLHVCKENLKHIFSKLKPQISFCKNDEKPICTTFGGELICSAVQHENMSLELLDMGAIGDEHQLANILPKLLKAIALSNSTGFFKKMKEKFPKLSEMIRMRSHKIDAAMAAVEKGHYEILEQLLSNGLDVNFSLNQGQLASFVACKRGDIECMKVLHKHGAKLVIEDPLSGAVLDHALFEAIFNGHLELIKFMAKEMLDDVSIQDKEGRNAIHIAVDSDQSDIIKFLNQVDNRLVNGRTKMGLSPLHCAVIAERWELCHWLIREGLFNVEILDSELLFQIDDVNFSEVCRDFKLMLSFSDNVNYTDNRGQSALHCAARYGCLDVLQQLILVAGADLEVTDQRGWNALHYACRGWSSRGIYSNMPLTHNVNGSERYLIAAKFLHDNDIHLIKKRTGDEKTALHLAVLENGDLAMIKWLVEELGIDVNAEDSSGHSAMQYAIEQQSWSVVFYLIEFGAAVDKKFIADYLAPTDYRNVAVINERGDTVVHLATVTSMVLLQKCIDLGADCRIANCLGEYPIHTACQCNHLAEAKYLHSLHSDLVEKSNHLGATTIHLAIDHHEDLEMLRWLVEHAKVNINTVHFDGDTVVVAALKQRRWNAVDYLLTQTGIDIHQKNRLGMNALLYATYHGRLETLDKLLGLKSDPAEKNILGLNAFHIACENNNLRVAKFLLPYCGKSTTEMTNQGQNVLQLSVSNATLAKEIDVCELIKWLLENVNVDVNHVDENKETALLIASRRNIWSAVNVLLQHGADVHQKDANEMTVLHYAAFYGNVEMIEKLVSEFGADLSAKNNQGQNAMHFACFKSELEAAKFLNRKKRGLIWEVTIDHNTALHIAVQDIQLLDLAMVRWLVEEVCLDPEALNSQGQSALLIACASQRLDIVSYLHRIGAKIDVVDKQGKTALHHFAKFGRRKNIETFLRLGLHLRAKCNSGFNILHEACMSRNYELIFQLIRSPLAAEKTKDGKTVLHLAVEASPPILPSEHAGVSDEINFWTNHQTLVEKILSSPDENFPSKNLLHVKAILRMLENQDVDVNAEDENGVSALLLAFQKNEMRIAYSLIVMKSDQIVIDINENMIDLCFLLNAYMGDPEILQICLNMNANINAVDKRGNTALHYAADSNLDALKALIMFGTEVSTKNRNGWNAMHVACTGLHLDAAKMLHMKNSSLIKERTHDGETVLHLVTSKSRPGIRAEDVEEIQNWIVEEAGVELDARDNENRTALQKAILHNDYECVKNLHKLQAKVAPKQ
ncbi:uncharacterized protein LOC135937463 [Cloeon dipterum]|uniref:uncharacterized protein LOC135937463 n=1 Tax=Cloeon dipterum TaxID=197152 RepID=UPI0032208446